MISTIDPKDIGVHTVTLKVELADYPEMSPFIKKEVIFKVTVSGVCEKTTFIEPKSPNILYQVNSVPQYVDFDGYKDKESFNNKPYDGQAYCGKRTYKMTSALASVKF